MSAADDQIFKRLSEPERKPPAPAAATRWKCPQGHYRWAHEAICPLCGADKPRIER